MDLCRSWSWSKLYQVLFSWIWFKHTGQKNNSLFFLLQTCPFWKTDFFQLLACICHVTHRKRLKVWFSKIHYCKPIRVENACRAFFVWSFYWMHILFKFSTGVAFVKVVQKKFKYVCGYASTCQGLSAAFEFLFCETRDIKLSTWECLCYQVFAPIDSEFITFTSINIIMNEKIDNHSSIKPALL